MAVARDRGRVRGRGDPPGRRGGPRTGRHTHKRCWSSIYNANIVGKLQYNNNFDLEVIVISIILNTYCIN